MRSIPVMLFLLISCYVGAQTPNGCYKNSNEIYCFGNNNEFDWAYSSGNRKEISRGTYKVKGNSIELNFGKIKRSFELQLNESQANHSDRGHIEVRAMLSDGKPFPGLRVILVQSEIDTETDSRGIANINLSDPVLKDQIRIDLNGCQSPPMAIDLRGHDHIFGVVIEATTKYHDNQSVVLSFNKKGRKIRLDGKQFKRFGSKKVTDVCGG